MIISNLVGHKLTRNDLALVTTLAPVVSSSLEVLNGKLLHRAVEQGIGSVVGALAGNSLAQWIQNGKEAENVAAGRPKQSVLNKQLGTISWAGLGSSLAVVLSQGINGELGDPCYDCWEGEKPYYPSD